MLHQMGAEERRTNRLVTLSAVVSGDGLNCFAKQYPAQGLVPCGQCGLGKAPVGRWRHQAVVSLSICLLGCKGQANKKCWLGAVVSVGYMGNWHLWKQNRIPAKAGEECSLTKGNATGVFFWVGLNCHNYFSPQTVVRCLFFLSSVVECKFRVGKFERYERRQCIN